MKINIDIIYDSSFTLGINIPRLYMHLSRASSDQDSCFSHNLKKCNAVPLHSILLGILIFWWDFSCVKLYSSLKYNSEFKLDPTARALLDRLPFVEGHRLRDAYFFLSPYFIWLICLLRCSCIPSQVLPFCWKPCTEYFSRLYHQFLLLSCNYQALCIEIQLSRTHTASYF